MSVLSALRRKPRVVLLDLRPLQCGYAGRGIGRYTAELAPRLAARLKSRESKRGRPLFTVFSLVTEGEANPLPDIPVKFSAPPWKRMWLWDRFVLPWMLIRHGISRFHNFVAVGPLDRVSCPGRPASRILATVHDWHMFADDASDLERFYRGTRRIGMQKKSLRRLRRVIVVSEQIKVETIMRASVDADRIAIVPPAGDHLNALPPEPWHMENFVLSVGDMPNKNLAFTRDVLALLRSKYVHLNWVVVGSRKRVLAELGPAEGGLPAWITVLENPSDALLKSCYQKALCLLFPSTREGFGIPLLEAMHLGCPVLASNLEPMRSLVDHAPSLVRPGSREDWVNAVRKVLYSADLRRELAEAGRKRAELMTWDASADALAALYP